MSNSNKEEIIDLTSSDNSIPKNNSDVVEVIDLLDASFDDGETKQPDVNTRDRKKTSKVGNRTKPSLGRDKSKEAKNFGFCSVCSVQLKKTQLQSTKFGIVYCLNCLKKTLNVEKHCTTCRCNLEGVLKYYTLYLEQG